MSLFTYHWIYILKCTEIIKGGFYLLEQYNISSNYNLMTQYKHILTNIAFHLLANSGSICVALNKDSAHQNKH